MSRTPSSAVPAADDASGQRSQARDSLFLTAQIAIEGERGIFDVRVRNLSEGGLMVEFGRTVPVHRPVALNLRGIGEVAGHVAWCAEGRLGIAFDRPINPMLARKPLTKGEGTPVYAKAWLSAQR